MKLQEDKMMRSLLIDGGGEIVGYIKKRDFWGRKKFIPIAEVWLKHEVFRRTNLPYPKDMV